MSDGAKGSDDSEVSGPRSGVSKAPEGLLGLTIDRRYRVEALLGEGGMGLVYRVTHTRLNKPLAIKVLRRENTRDPEVLARFRREAESASGIGNQHIVDIHDFGELDDGSTYFVMECLEGLDLIDEGEHRLFVRNRDGELSQTLRTVALHRPCELLSTHVEDLVVGVQAEGRVGSAMHRRGTCVARRMQDDSAMRGFGRIG